MRLTQYSAKAGRASKFAPGDLEQALEGLASESLEDFVSGMNTRDDKGYVPFGGGLLVQLLGEDGFSASAVGEFVNGAGVRVTA